MEITKFSNHGRKFAVTTNIDNDQNSHVLFFNLCRLHQTTLLVVKQSKIRSMCINYAYSPISVSGVVLKQTNCM